MLLSGVQKHTRKKMYDLAKEAVRTNKRTGIGKLKLALKKLGRPLCAGNMQAIPEGGLPSLSGDALVLVQFHGNNSKHWMVWDHRRQLLLDPEEAKSHFSAFKILRQIEVAA